MNRLLYSTYILINDVCIKQESLIGMPPPLQIVLQNSLLSEILIRDSNRNFIEIHLISIHWFEIRTIKSSFFQPAATNRIKATYMYILSISD